jgi:hypothetical protein
MLTLRYAAFATALTASGVAIFAIFLAGAFYVAKLPISSAGWDEWAYLAVCFFLSLLFVVAMLHRAQVKFEANSIPVPPLTYFFMSTALAAFLWSFSFFSWCAQYHSTEFLHHSAERYFKVAFLGSILGSFIIGSLSVYLAGPRLRSSAQGLM